MAYSTGILNERITVATKMTAVDGAFGRNSGGVRYAVLGEYWANVTFNRGVRTLREGAVDNYDTVIIRMRYNGQVNRDCLIGWDGRCFAITSFNAIRHENIMQLTVVEAPDRMAEFSTALQLATADDLGIADSADTPITTDEH